MADNIIVLKDVVKKYGENTVVKKINLEIKQGEFLTLLGPSGCGKTTTLRMIAGFESITSGEVLLDGQDIGMYPSYSRPVNTVFQNYALFPHMNVYDNIAYGLKMKKVGKDEIKLQVKEILKSVQLEGFEKRKPEQMSGGQKQRVAIARALINSPKVLLLDEPLGALDYKLRKQMQLELKRLQKKLGITFIYVTHDQEEAMTMSDRVAIMNNGVIEQIDKPDIIYGSPKTRFVANFIGESNIFEAVVNSVNEEGNAIVCGEVGRFVCKSNGFQLGDLVYVCVRPESMLISKNPVKDFSLQGEVIETIYVGNLIKTVIRLSNNHEIIVSRLATDERFLIGEKVFLYWKPEHGILMKNRSGLVYSTIAELVEKLKIQ